MTPAQAITQHFKGEWNGSQGAFPTPGHSASDRGTTVKDIAGGDVVFCCHNDSNFDWQAMKDDCRRLGLLPDRIRQSSDDRWRVTGTYEYADADGAIAYRTIRVERTGERKQFRAQRPDGCGGWLNGLDKNAAYQLDLPRASVQPRTSELRAKGLILDSGKARQPRPCLKPL